MAIYNCCRAHPLHFFPIPLFSKKHFPTDFKVTQVKSRKQKLLNETPEELVVANGSNFDILLPLISLGNSPRIYFDFLDALSILKKLGKTMVWQSAGYFFLKFESRFWTGTKKSLIWHPAMVSMTKTQLTIRQNVNKLKIQKFHFFFQLRFGFLCISCHRSLNMDPRPCSLIQEVQIFS